MAIKQLSSGCYEVTGRCGSVCFHIGICDTIEKAKEIERQLSDVVQVYQGDIHATITARCSDASA